MGKLLRRNGTASAVVSVLRLRGSITYAEVVNIITANKTAAELMRLSNRARAAVKFRNGDALTSLERLSLIKRGTALSLYRLIYQVTKREDVLNDKERKLLTFSVRS
jgi:hypothetical protein